MDYKNDCLESLNTTDASDRAAYHAQIVSYASSYKRLTTSLNVAFAAVKWKKPVKQHLTGWIHVQVVGRVTGEALVAGRSFQGVRAAGHCVAWAGPAACRPVAVAAFPYSRAGVPS